MFTRSINSNNLEESLAKSTLLFEVHELPLCEAKCLSERNWQRFKQLSGESISVF